MGTPLLLEFELVENAAAVVAVFGQFNLYDAEIRALRFACDADAEASLEVQIHPRSGNAPGESLRN